MRAFVIALCAAAIAVPAASAKGRLAVRVADRTPAVGQSFRGRRRHWLGRPRKRLAAADRGCAGRDWHDVVGTVTGDLSRAHATIPRDGFEIALERVAPRRWHAAVRLPRSGRWRLVVPNGTHAGVMLPPPAAWMPWVEVHR